VEVAITIDQAGAKTSPQRHSKVPHQTAYSAAYDCVQMRGDGMVSLVGYLCAWSTFDGERLFKKGFRCKDNKLQM